MSEAARPGDGLVLITFALPDESRDLTRRLANVRKLTPRDHLSSVVGEWSGQKVLVLHTGVGGANACRQRLDRALRDARPRLVVSAGYAGGLAPALRTGELLLGQNHSDSKLLAAARAALADEPLHVGTLLTQAAVAETAAEKAALHAATMALAVDMETAWIATACADVGVPLLSLRVISDAADLSFPVPGHILFDAARQRPRYLALPCYLLTHPARVAPFVRFVRGLGPARARLTTALQRLLAVF